MIRIDLTAPVVTFEGDGDVDHLVTVRTMQTSVAASRVTKFRRPTVDMLRLAGSAGYGPQDDLTETVRSRSGSEVLREYDLREPGFYSLVGGGRGHPTAHSLILGLEFQNTEFMDILVLPGSRACSLVVADQIVDYRDGGTLRFTVRVTHAGVALGDGEIARIESDRDGVTFHRATAWSRLLADEDV